MSRLVVLVWLAGCSFTPGIGPAASAASDASAGNEAGAADARQSHDAAAALDAKLFLDAPPASATGSITVTSALLGAGDTNVSTEGTLDWAHWGYTSATS